MMTQWLSSIISNKREYHDHISSTPPQSPSFSRSDDHQTSMVHEHSYHHNLIPSTCLIEEDSIQLQQRSSLDRIIQNPIKKQQQQQIIITTTQQQQLDEKHQKVEELKIRYPSLFQEVLVFEDDNDQKLCPICLELYTEENPEVSCKCGHGFHLQCSEEWKQRSSQCPVCFRKLIYSFEEEELPKEEEYKKSMTSRHDSVTTTTMRNYYMNEPLVTTREDFSSRGKMLKRILRCLCCCFCCC
ncbi:hypothetical protein C9374_009923 [Naegleria lovaniensis]|uniref:RING-type E3 ubiquitin transferase n=1 Tax=Naegleria lovaniensis TaxID=51637 RepID=A0AA88GD08_NAELO|nr:uncharacterized protein C9374_009923 [Naegleria lovaniensis]KAG2375300.1 hypothetical protein C9374_009923 [Naegleria lovaniensis]